MRLRLRRENSGFDEYINVYDEKNKLVYYSMEVDYARPKRLVYNKAQIRVAMVDFSPVDIDDIMNGFPIYINEKKVAFYDDTLPMNSTERVEFAHVIGPEFSFIEESERLTFKEYVLVDNDGGVVMKIKRAGTDFVCDIPNSEDVMMSVIVACIEYWRYITTTRDF
ncbi:MAG: hypothetical protein LBL82_05595 [Oscillospiraceae bacterium]|nr:hypothetical protein [Oscillospiraceae bacterium]